VNHASCSDAWGRGLVVPPLRSDRRVSPSRFASVFHHRKEKGVWTAHHTHFFRGQAVDDLIREGKKGPKHGILVYLSGTFFNKMLFFFSSW
jgi:hypothetical protein